MSGKSATHMLSQADESLVCALSSADDEGAVGLVSAECLALPEAAPMRKMTCCCHWSSGKFLAQSGMFSLGNENSDIAFRIFDAFTAKKFSHLVFLIKKTKTKSDKMAAEHNRACMYIQLQFYVLNVFYVLKMLEAKMTALHFSLSNHPLYDAPGVTSTSQLRCFFVARLSLSDLIRFTPRRPGCCFVLSMKTWSSSFKVFWLVPNTESVRGLFSVCVCVWRG